MSAGSRGLVALEEHYLDAELAAIHGIASSPMTAKLEDITGVRLREMDEAGIAVQVLSHAPAGLQRVDSAVAVALAQRVNTRLAGLVALAPDRFAAFAALPTPAGSEAADLLPVSWTRCQANTALLERDKVRATGERWRMVVSGVKRQSAKQGLGREGCKGSGRGARS